MPAQHQSASEWTPERLLHWADEIGPHTQQLLRSIIASRQHPEQAFRSCLGILHLSHQYTHDQLETACQLAQQAKTLNYQGVKAFLETLPVTENKPVLVHENIRGNSYYQ